MKNFTAVNTLTNEKVPVFIRYKYPFADKPLKYIQAVFPDKIIPSKKSTLVLTFRQIENTNLWSHPFTSWVLIEDVDFDTKG